VSGIRYEDAVAAVDAHLGHKAAKHCKRVAETAAELATTYGVDPDAARLAGLLHDWDREVPRDELVLRARRFGIKVTDSEESSPYLLHARTGALAVKDAFPALPTEISCAISRHTVGSADMTPLDMVVYLADTIEPHRAYPGVDELRDAVGVVPLAELFALGYQLSMRNLIDTRRRIDPESVAVWNALVAGDRS
jgi:predicted HD superfamily hydrolase involved in NAD metabolism